MSTHVHVSLLSAYVLVTHGMSVIGIGTKTLYNFVS